MNVGGVEDLNDRFKYLFVDCLMLVCLLQIVGICANGYQLGVVWREVFVDTLSQTWYYGDVILVRQQGINYADTT